MGVLLPDLLAAAADAHPDRPAIEDGPDVLSYSELEARALHLAEVLRESGSQPGDRIGLYLDKSTAAVIAIYGILKAGCVYVPLDVHAPTSRLAHILRDCDVRCTVSALDKQGAWADLGAAGGIATWIAADATASQIPDLPGPLVVAGAGLASRLSDVDRTRSDSDTALILYTSGSTGRPKGVTLSHRNVMTFVAWAVRRFELTPIDRLSSHAPFHFDLSTFDLFGAASAASVVVLVPRESSVFPAQLARFISEKKLTTWYSVPSALTMLTLRGRLQTLDLHHLRTVLFAGEVFPKKHLRDCMSLLPQARFFNLYGPTETNVCTYYEVPDLDDEDDRAVPIGKAIDDVEVFAVRGDRIAEVGEEGELYVSGPSVMHGYWAKPEETSRVLVADPRPEREGIAYRTGDLVSQEPDGHFRFLGRRDSQVKTRGYRVELGEIEAVLNAHPGVVECAVVAVPDEIISNRLKAFIVFEVPLSNAELSAFCADRLPRYMIPERFASVESLPKTSTGKTDRQLLKEGPT